MDPSEHIADVADRVVRMKLYWARKSRWTRSGTPRERLEKERKE